MITLNLVRFIFNQSRSASIRIIGDPYEMHQFVYETMSAGADPGRLLYRMEADYGFHSSEPYVLVQTENAVVPQIGDRWGTGGFVRMESKSSSGVLKESGVYRFRSRVNPVRSERPECIGGRGKRRGIMEAEGQIEWFSRRLADSGMRLVDADHRCEARLKIIHKKNPMVFASAFFEGTLEVTDTKLAEKAVIEGIGPGKGFGFGMISLARG